MGCLACQVPVLQEIFEVCTAVTRARARAQSVRFSENYGSEPGSGGTSDSEPRAFRTLATSGGSVSLAAQHFCPVCGIIATSQANLEARPPPRTPSRAPASGAGCEARSRPVCARRGTRTRVCIICSALRKPRRRSQRLAGVILRLGARCRGGRARVSQPRLMHIPALVSI